MGPPSVPPVCTASESDLTGRPNTGFVLETGRVGATSSAAVDAVAYGPVYQSDLRIDDEELRRAATKPEVDSGTVPENGVHETAATELRPVLPPQESTPLGVPRRVDAATAESSGIGLSETFRTFGALGVVLVLALALRGVVRAWARRQGSLAVLLSAGGHAPSGVLEVLGRYPVARGTTLVLLKVDRRVLLLSQTAGGFQTLADISDPNEVASILTKTASEQSEGVTDRFRSIFREFERGRYVDNEFGPGDVVDLTAADKPLQSLRMRLDSLRRAGA
jgi:flagellar biogenesis protein FliO